MNKTFRQEYNEWQEVEGRLADRWGYSLTTNSIECREKRHIEAAHPVVANINPRKFTKEISKTDKIKQVEDEIRGLENERMLRELKDSKYQEASLDEKSEVICLMEAMIEDYNNIIQHRHIAARARPLAHPPRHDERTHTRARQNHQLLEVIESKKKQLLNADLKEHIKINKEIAQLYRQYNDTENNLSAISLKNNRSIAPEAPTYKTMKKHQSETFEKLEELASLNSMTKFLSLKMTNSEEHLDEMVSLFRRQSDISRQIDDETIKKKFRELQLKKFNKSFRKQSTHQSAARHAPPKAKDIDQQINEPFLDRHSVEEYREMEKKIRSNSDALELWKIKITDASQNSRLKRQAERAREISKRRAEIEMQQREQQIEHILEKSIEILSVDSNNNQNVFTKEFLQSQRNHEEEKEKILAELLRKKNNKFNKLWGTKILVKYDSEKEAKSMLKGADERRLGRKAKTSMSHRRNLSVGSKIGDTSRLIRTQQNMGRSARDKISSQEQSAVSWIADQKDEEHYWRMCKNQKVNLLLKRR